jgi:phosphoribosylanthranilate isomerase
MLIKICGMRDSANIRQVAALKPDLMGFIFYPKSKRYVGEDFDLKLVYSLMPEILTVGVFVNLETEALLAIAKKYRFDYVQLHGNESPGYCKEVREEGIKVLKAFGIHDNFDWSTLLPYQKVCDYFLFDTSSKDFGGSGQKFNWNILGQYTIQKPFFLSGGISPEDISNIKNIANPNLKGIDINSKFEIEPGLKNIELIKVFIEKIRTNDAHL